MKHKIQQLLELQLQKSLKHIEKNNSIEYNSLLDFVNENILKLSILLPNEKNDPDLIKKKLIHLMDNVPDFLWRNKKLNDMTTNFISICKDDGINTETINNEFMERMILSYINTLN